MFVFWLDVLFFDELISVLDLEFVGEVLFVIKEFVDEGWIMVVVMYELSFVCEVVDYVLFLDGGVIVE